MWYATQMDLLDDWVTAAVACPLPQQQQGPFISTHTSTLGSTEISQCTGHNQPYLFKATLRIVQPNSDESGCKVLPDPYQAPSYLAVLCG